MAPFIALYVTAQSFIRKGLLPRSHVAALQSLTSCGLSSARHHSTGTAPEHYPVAIIGAGPSGLTLSMLLSQFGIKNVVLERDGNPSEHPRAHFLNHRTMEVFRSMSGFAQVVQSSSPPLDEWRRFMYCETLTGQLLGQVDHFPGAHRPLNPSLSPEPVTHLPQNRLIPLMLQHCQQHCPNSTVLLGYNVDRMEKRHEGSMSIISKLAEEQHTLTCSYLVAADGANSTVRQQLPEVKMEGQAAIQHLISVHFFSPHLAKLLHSRPAMLYFVFNSDVVGVVIAHNLAKGEFVAQFPYSPPLEALSDFPPAECSRLINAAAGEQLGNIDVQSVKPWVMSALVASKYQVDRIFLVGDAAHRMPPSGGFGMNTAIQDSHNLAWKLAAVINGSAHEQLLRSYEMERRAVAVSNTRLSMANWQDAVQVPRALGLDPDNMRLLLSVVDALPLPEGRKKTLYQSTVAVGRQLAGLKGPLQPIRQTILDRVFNEGETLRLEFPQQDLGFSYQAGALYPFQAEATPRPSHFRHQTPANNPNPVTNPGQLPHLSKPYEPQPMTLPVGFPSFAPTGLCTPHGSRTQPSSPTLSAPTLSPHPAPHTAPFKPSPAAGHRLPHLPLLLHSQDPPSTVSTLDLLASAPPLPTLFIGWQSGDNARSWMAAATQLHCKGHYVRVVCVVSHIREVKEALRVLRAHQGGVGAWSEAGASGMAGVVGTARPAARTAGTAGATGAAGIATHAGLREQVPGVRNDRAPPNDMETSKGMHIQLPLGLSGRVRTISTVMTMICGTSSREGENWAKTRVLDGGRQAKTGWEGGSYAPHNGVGRECPCVDPTWGPAVHARTTLGPCRHDLDGESGAGVHSCRYMRGQWPLSSEGTKQGHAETQQEASSTQEGSRTQGDFRAQEKSRTHAIPRTQQFCRAQGFNRAQEGSSTQEISGPQGLPMHRQVLQEADSTGYNAELSEGLHGASGMDRSNGSRDQSLVGKGVRGTYSGHNATAAAAAFGTPRNGDSVSGGDMQAAASGAGCLVNKAGEKEQLESVVAIDMEGMWERLVGKYDEAVVLVRPDGHVAWSRQAAAAGPDVLMFSELWRAWDHCMGVYLHTEA